MNTMIEGNSIGIDEPQPPYGLSDTVYNGLLSLPIIWRTGRRRMLLRIRLSFPPLNARAEQPANAQSVFDNIYNPQSGMTAPTP